MLLVLNIGTNGGHRNSSNEKIAESACNSINLHKDVVIIDCDLLSFVLFFVILPLFVINILMNDSPKAKLTSPCSKGCATTISAFHLFIENLPICLLKTKTDAFRETDFLEYLLYFSS